MSSLYDRPKRNHDKKAPKFEKRGTKVHLTPQNGPRPKFRVTDIDEYRRAA